MKGGGTADTALVHFQKQFSASSASPRPPRENSFTGLQFDLSLAGAFKRGDAEDAESSAQWEITARHSTALALFDVTKSCLD